MLEIVLRPKAEADVRYIADYTESEWGDRQAKRYIEALRAVINRAAMAPNLGSIVEGLPLGYRKMPSGSHRIIYRVDSDSLIVVRVLHERMDVGSALDLG